MRVPCCLPGHSALAWRDLVAAGMAGSGAGARPPPPWRNDLQARDLILRPPAGPCRPDHPRHVHRDAAGGAGLHPAPLAAPEHVRGPRPFVSACTPPPPRSHARAPRRPGVPRPRTLAAEALEKQAPTGRGSPQGRAGAAGGEQRGRRHPAGTWASGAYQFATQPEAAPRGGAVFCGTRLGRRRSTTTQRNLSRSRPNLGGPLHRQRRSRGSRPPPNAQRVVRARL